MKTKKTASKKIIKNKIKKIKAVKKVIRKPIVQKKKVEKAKPVPKEIVIDAKKISDFEVLEKLLGDNNKVKLWKVFVLNTNKEFLLKDLIKLSRIKKDNLILELRELMRIGLVKANKKEHHIFYKTNKDFPLLSEITNLVLSVVPRSAEKVLEKLNTLNKLKTVLLSGFFTSTIGKQKQDFESFNSNSNIDLLLVFEKIPDNVSDIISELEFNIGKELSYSALEQNDFRYRHSIGDKLIRDVLDFDHVVAMDKLSFFR